MTRKLPLLFAAAGLSLACSACSPQWLMSLRAHPKHGYEVGYPPPDKVEVVPPAPGAGYVWIQGHWLWHNDLNDYRWVPGRWEHAEPVVYVSRKPPKAKREVASARPHRGDVWVAGHWAWEKKGYHWIAGRWTKPAKGFHAWVSGHWEHEKRGWHYVAGHWR